MRGFRGRFLREFRGGFLQEPFGAKGGERGVLWKPICRRKARWIASVGRVRVERSCAGAGVKVNVLYEVAALLLPCDFWVRFGPDLARSLNRRSDRASTLFAGS